MRAYSVYVHGLGNTFMVELARLLADGLSELGLDASLQLDGLPTRSSSTVDLIVDPEAYASIEGPTIEADLCSAVERSVVIGTEQPGTVWFDRQLPYLGPARLVLDLDSHAIEHLGRLGIHSRRLRLGYHDSWDHWGGDASRLRPRDVAFLGAVNDRRERFLAEAASRLWDRRFELRLFEVTRPKHAGDPGFLTGPDKWSWLAGTRLLLNVHRGLAPYFEWLRAVEAMVNGCVLLTEPSDDPAPLIPGEHFVQAPLHLLVEYAIGLLADRSGVAAIADAAYQFLRTEWRMADLLRPVVEEIESLTPVGPRRLARPIAPAPALPLSPGRAAEEVPDAQHRVGFRVTGLVPSGETHRRRLGALERCLSHVDAGNEAVERTAGWEGFDADVSVVMALSERRQSIDDAVDSALGSLDVNVEVIVVDHRSPDRSGEAVRRRMEEDQRAPLCLVSKSAYRGRAAAWCSGITVSRAPFVFFLDAEEILYPYGLAKLRGALVASPAAFAYGIVQRVGAEPGLRSYLPWDVDRLCAGNYLSGGVLVRRHELQQVGGFDESLVTSSASEEYDLWLRFAADGYWGTLVPEVVVRRQSRPLSMVSVSKVLDRDQQAKFFRDRYPDLPWPVP